MTTPDKIRNLAVIAHIDHGKTTLLDALLKQSQTFRENQVVDERVMDSNDQEKERGITIFAKPTTVFYKDHKINIIDTPGHADFSGEVERILGMVDSVLLLVDAYEGPMPQTRFVLSKALKMGIKPIVVINKIDRPHAEPDRVLDETFDLFVELNANDEQLDFKHCYASGFNGYAKREIEDPATDITPLFDLILEAVPAPTGSVDAPFALQAATVIYDDYLGRQACGRIANGTVKKGQSVLHIDNEGNKTRGNVLRVQGFRGLEKCELEEASVGDIAIVSGFADVKIGDTLCDPANPVQLPAIAIDEPTLAVDFTVNTSPLVGRSGKHVTINKIRERLEREQRANISLKIDLESSHDAISVAGRGELHLSVLIEAMRREGYEFSVSKPRVLVKETDEGKLEPIEKVYIEVPEEYSGTVIDDMNKRRGEMVHMSTNEHGITEIEFTLPTRGLMGYRGQFITKTRGLGILTTVFDSYGPWRGEIPGRQNGSLVSMCAGKSNGYACFNLQERGSLFVSPGEDVYQGMIVGRNSRSNDLAVNITKAKQLTNVRASGTDENIVLTPPLKMTLERAIEYIESDELLEVTPDVIRLRKINLTAKM
jgi:GTP-binding protein